MDSGNFPFEEVGGRRVMKQVQDLFVRPTVTALVDMVRVALTDLCRQFGVELVSVPPDVLLGLGIHTPMLGVPLDMNPSHLSSRPWSSAFAEMDSISTDQKGGRSHPPFHRDLSRLAAGHAARGAACAAPVRPNVRDNYCYLLLIQFHYWFGYIFFFSTFNCCIGFSFSVILSISTS